MYLFADPPSVQHNLFEAAACTDSCLRVFVSSVLWYGFARLFNHSSVEEHLSCFQFGAVMNKVLQTFVYSFLSFISLG